MLGGVFPDIYAQPISPQRRSHYPPRQRARHNLFSFDIFPLKISSDSRTKVLDVSPDI